MTQDYWLSVGSMKEDWHDMPDDWMTDEVKDALSSLAAFEAKLIAFLLSDNAVANYLLTQIALTNLPRAVVQALAEKMLQASGTLESRGDPALDIAHLRALLSA